MFLRSIHTKQLQPGYNLCPVVFRIWLQPPYIPLQLRRLQPDTLVPDTIVPDTLQPPYIPLEAANSCSWYVYLQPDIKQHQRQNNQHQPGRLQPPYIPLQHQDQEKIQKYIRYICYRKSQKLQKQQEARSLLFFCHHYILYNR